MGPRCCRWCSNSRVNFMNQRFVAAFLLLAPAALFGADSQWVLGASTLSYLVSHPLHESVGVSHDARGKGVCHGGQCDFLIAVPVKSFDSKDSNRDLHMLQVTRGGQFPMVTVRVLLPESELTSATHRTAPRQCSQRRQNS